MITINGNTILNANANTGDTFSSRISVKTYDYAIVWQNSWFYAVTKIQLTTKKNYRLKQSLDLKQSWMPSKINATNIRAPKKTWKKETTG